MWEYRFALLLACVLVARGGAALVLREYYAEDAHIERIACRFGFCEDQKLQREAFRAISTGQQLPAAVDTLRETLRRSPASPYRWCDLGDAFLQIGDRESAGYCFQRALELGPNIPPVLLRGANYSFLSGNVAQALPRLKQVLALTGQYDQPVFSLYRRLAGSTDIVLSEGLPEQERAAQSYFRFLLRTRQEAAAEHCWRWILSRSLGDETLAIDYVRFLLERRRFEAASEVWASFHRSLEPEYMLSNHVFNPGFERSFAIATFDWQVEPVETVTVDRAAGIARSGDYSLRVRFHGGRNLHYQHVSQSLHVKPGHYQLTAYVRSNNLTTDEGIRFRIFDAEQSRRLDVLTSGITGTVDWKLARHTVLIPEATRLVKIQLFRVPSRKFDNRIAGTVWIDDVSLAPAG